MYIRYVLSWRHPASRVEAGFFSLAYRVAAEDRVPEWIRAELMREIEWFDARLPVPGRLRLRFRRRRAIEGICWFRPEAGEAIVRARYVGWLMTEAGAPLQEIRTADPGEIMWRDAMQVVARPPRTSLRGY